MKENNIKKSLIALIESAGLLGLGKEDLSSAKEFLIHHEFGLAFDTIVTQLYEFDIEINNEFYQAIKSIGSQMNLSEDSYVFMKGLIRDEGVIPKPVKDQIKKIIASLSQ